MAVRSFNGTTDLITCATGAASGMTHGTIAAIVRLQGTSTFRQILAIHDSGGTFIASALAAESSNHWEMFAGASSATTFTNATSIWYLIVVRKATGTATPRFSQYNMTTPGWTHGAGGGTLANWSAPGASGSFRFNFQNTDDWFNGYVAARAVWANTLPWTADASGDTSLEGAGLEDAASNWASQNPSAFWLFNQASTATPVDDLSTTGTADQTAISGTTVIGGDDPPGFDFALTVTVPQVALQSASAWTPF